MRLSLFPFSNLVRTMEKLEFLISIIWLKNLIMNLQSLLGKKFTNGFIRNGHDVIEISDRDFIRQQKSINF